MAGDEAKLEEIPFDTSEVDKWIGVPLGGGVLKAAIGTTDVRRWAQGMQDPNPLYFDDEYAAEARLPTEELPAE
jgi:hypothetical protein